VTTITASSLCACYGRYAGDKKMDQHKLHRPDRVPVGPNRLNRLTEVLIALAFLLAMAYLMF
jgi:hypothetical protein